MKDANLSWPCAWRVFLQKWVRKRQTDFDAWFGALLVHLETASPPQCPLRGMRGFYNRKRLQGRLSFPGSWTDIPADLNCPVIVT